MNSNSNNKIIDFIWSSKKDYYALYPLYKYFVHKKWEVRFYKIHKSKIINNIKYRKIANNVILSYSGTYYRLKNAGWKGKFIYVDHGIAPIKYYSYIYDFFFEADLLFYPGEIFKKKMTKILNTNYSKALIGGFPIADDLLNTKIDKFSLIKKYNLDKNKPIILFAPTWGSKKKSNWGINNLKYLSNIENLITLPHPADYQIAKFFKNTIIPKNRMELNQILHLSDIVISDISSIILEASLIKKNTIQIILDNYPGAFPDIDMHDKNISANKELLQYEIENSDTLNRPFKISFLDEDMIVDYTSTLENINNTIDAALKNPKKNLDKQKYWTEQCCWKADGSTNDRIYRMISNYIIKNEIKQLD